MANRDELDKYFGKEWTRRYQLLLAEGIGAGYAAIAASISGVASDLVEMTHNVDAIRVIAEVSGSVEVDDDNST